MCIQEQLNKSSTWKAYREILSRSFVLVYFNAGSRICIFIFSSHIQLLLILQWSTRCFFFLLVSLFPMDLSYSCNLIHHLKHITLL